MLQLYLLTPMLASTLSSVQNKRATFSSASDSSCSQKPMSRSSVVSKSTQNQDLLQQISLLKQKAHQSFMQVIQIQQLHEEQLEQLRNQFTTKQTAYQNQLEQLKARILQLEYQNSTIDKNARQHHFELAEELSIESIEPISYLEESKLDESSIVNFAQFVAFQASQDKLLSVKHEMKVEIRSISTQNNEQLLKVQDMIDKLFEYVMHLRREFSNLQDNFSQMKLQSDENEDLNSNCKKFTESLQRENKFISENIKRLASEKMKVEKQLSEAERKVKTLEQKLKKFEQASTRKQIKSSEVAMKKAAKLQQNDRSLDLNQFIQQNLNVAKSQNNPKHRLAFANRYSKI